jgi:hypothetical protein
MIDPIDFLFWPVCGIWMLYNAIAKQSWLTVFLRKTHSGRQGGLQPFALQQNLMV